MPSLFIYHTHHDFNNADSSSMQDDMTSVKWPCSPCVLVAQWIECPPSCSGGHGFDSCQGLRLFLCSMLMSCQSVHFLLYFVIYLPLFFMDFRLWSCVIFLFYFLTFITFINIHTPMYCTMQKITILTVAKLIQP